MKTLVQGIPNWDQMNPSQRLGVIVLAQAAATGQGARGVPGGVPQTFTGATWTAPSTPTAPTVSRPATTSPPTTGAPRPGAVGHRTATPTNRTGLLQSSPGQLMPLPPTGGSSRTRQLSGVSTGSGNAESESPTVPALSTTSSTTSSSSRRKRPRQMPSKQAEVPKRKRGRPRKEQGSAASASTSDVCVNDDVRVNDDDDDSDEDQDDIQPDTGEVDEPSDDVPRASPQGPWTLHTVEEKDIDVRTWMPESKAGRLVDGVERPAPGARGFKSRKSAPPGPRKVFNCFLPEKLLVSIAEASTAYAQASTTARWRKENTTLFHDGVITSSDVLRFVAALFIMGEKKLPSKKLYWVKYHTDPRLSLLFPTYGDFSFMTRNLHFLDTTVFSKEEQREKNKRDSFWKMGDFPTSVSALFKKFRMPSKLLTVDEFVIPFKGRHRSRMMNKDKPEKYHLKGFSLNEAGTGYCLGFYMYRGAEEQRPSNVSASAWPIHALLGGYTEIHHAGYHLCADNWFTGVGLIQDVASWGVDYTGTCRKDRVDGAFDDEDVTMVEIPDKRKGAKKGAVRMKKEVQKWKAERGTARYRKRTYGDVDVFCTQWQDSKVVSLMSTTDGVQGVIQRKTLKNNKKNGKFSRVQITAPSSFMLYNYGKVGTDRMDQNVAQLYPRNRFHWPVKVFTHIVMMILNNSFISWREHQEHARAIPLRMYMNLLLEEILSFLNLRVDDICAAANAHEPFEEPATRAEGRDVGGKRANKDRGARGHCAQCRSNTRLKCKVCNVWLCANRPAKECWTEYHLDNDCYKNL